MSEKKEWTAGVKSVLKKVLIAGLYGVGTLAITATATSLFDGLATMSLSWGQTILSGLGIVAATTGLVVGCKTIRAKSDENTSGAVKTIKENADRAAEVVMEPYREEVKTLTTDVEGLKRLETELKKKEEIAMQAAEEVELTAERMMAISGAGSASLQTLTNDYYTTIQPDIASMKTK